MRVVTALLCATLAACHAASDSAFTEKRLVVATPQEPPSLDTLLIEGPAAALLDPLIYSYLLTIDDRGNLVPDLATAVPSVRNGGISRDGRTIVYHLRKGAVWQDGAPITAADVVFTQHAIMNPNNNVFSRFGNDRVASIEATDRWTVRIVLRKPYSPILTQFFGPANNYGVVPAHLLQDYPNVNHLAFNVMPVGSGPYRVKEWARGDHLTLVANPTYFRGRPKVEEIELKFVADSNTVLNQLRTGEVNAYFFSDPTHMREYSVIPGLRVSRAPFAAFGDLVFNTHSPAVSSAQVRQAIVGALNLPQIVRAATRGTQTTADPYRALYGNNTDPSIRVAPYDPESAKGMLGPQHLTVDFAYEAGKAASASVGLQMQEALRAAGVTLNMRAYSPELMRASAASGGPLMSGNFQLAFFEIFTTGDGDSSWYLDCAQIPPNGFNESRFCDPQAQQAQNALVATYDPAQQRHDSAIVQQRVADVAPFVSLWSQNAIYVTPRALSGFSPSQLAPDWNPWAWSLR